MKKWITMMAVATIAATGAYAQETEPSATYDWLGVDKGVVVPNEVNFNETFGYFYPFDTSSRWIFHYGLGLLYPLETTGDSSTWFWSEDFEWAWTGLGLFQYLYLADPGEWFWFYGNNEGTDDEPEYYWFSFDDEGGGVLKVPATSEKEAQ